LLKPQEHKLEEAKHFSIPHALEHKLSKLYNPSQLEAIAASLKQEGITLVQGPPGTGKTQTVLATLSVLLQSSVNRE
jgi:senataxin